MDFLIDIIKVSIVQKTLKIQGFRQEGTKTERERQGAVHIIHNIHMGFWG